MVRNYVCKRPKLYSEEGLKAALTACKGPSGMTVRAAAKLWNIPYETLRGRHMGVHKNEKPGPRRRVQATSGEIMTEERVTERLRVEEEGRKRKKQEKLAGKDMKGKGRGRGKGASKTTGPKAVGKKKSDIAPKAKAAPKTLSSAINASNPGWSRNLFKNIDISDSSEEEEEIINDHPELRQKHKSGLWSDDSDSEFGDNPESLKEALGIEDMYGGSDDNDLYSNQQVQNPDHCQYYQVNLLQDQVELGSVIVRRPGQLVKLPCHQVKRISIQMLLRLKVMTCLLIAMKMLFIPMMKLLLTRLGMKLSLTRVVMV